MKKVLAVALVVGAALAVAAPAFAHVTVQPSEAGLGSFSRFVVRVPNERPDAATTKVEVQFPETVTNASFQPKEGWDRTVKMKTLDEPIEVFGEEVTEAVDTVTWSGGSIEPGEFDEFGFSIRTPDDPGALEFSALQTYEGGEVVRWIGPADADEPAAIVNVIDTGFAEDEGQLSVLARLNQSAGEPNEPETQQTAASEDESDSSNLGVILGGVGTLLGGAALILALRKRA
ncbi:MAG: YcnI family protein [Actinomycetota bacterium]|nr:YcnI family protein [Actinomycetota bacterium]